MYNSQKESGILAEIPEFELTYNYSWDDFTTIYDKFGYYMFFEKGKMTVMLRQADVPEPGTSCRRRFY